jgi:two-component system, chemotaxis family, chemotaxis protein CheY
MLPTAAVDLLRFDMADANSLATQGDVKAGLEVLRAGLARAQGAQSAGHPWAEELLRYYQEALDVYVRSYGLPGTPSPENKSRRTAIGHGRILIVEDDPRSRTVLTDLLEEEGYAVAAVADGQAALEYLRQSSRPCLILLDLKTPRLDGWGFRAVQRQDPALATIPVVVLTALPVTVTQARELAAEGYLMKPYRPGVLLSLAGYH